MALLRVGGVLLVAMLGLAARPMAKEPHGLDVAKERLAAFELSVKTAETALREVSQEIAYLEFVNVGDTHVVTPPPDVISAQLIDALKRKAELEEQVRADRYRAFGARTAIEALSAPIPTVKLDFGMNRVMWKLDENTVRYDVVAERSIVFDHIVYSHDEADLSAMKAGRPDSRTHGCSARVFGASGWIYVPLARLKGQVWIEGGLVSTKDFSGLEVYDLFTPDPRLTDSKVMVYTGKEPAIGRCIIDLPSGVKKGEEFNLPGYGTLKWRKDLTLLQTQLPAGYYYEPSVTK